MFAERLVVLIDEGRLAILARQHGIKKGKESDSLSKLLVAALRREDEGTFGRFLVLASILLMAARQQPSQILKEAADVYKVDAEAIDLNVKQEFMAKEKARTEAKQSAKPAAKAVPRAKKAA